MKRVSTISLPVEIGLHFISMWPDSTYASLLMYMTLIVTVQYYQYAYVVAHFDLNNIPLLMDCLGLTLAHSLCLLKLSTLWWNRRTFYYIVKTMDEDWKERNVNDFYASTMVGMANLSRRCSIAMISFNAFGAFFFTIGEHMLHSLVANKGDHKPRVLPLKMQVPFDVSKSPIFEYFLLGQFLYEVVLASVVAMINSLLVSLILHVSGQIDIMRQEINEISHGKYDSSTFLMDIKGLICKHQKIITLSKKIESLFTYIALMQLLWNTLIICCSGFMLILGLSNNKEAMVLIKTAFLYFAKALEVFVFCYAGEFLSYKNKSICDAVYESLWYNLMPSNCRVLLVIMIRSQKQLTITAGKILDLTLDGFMSVMKASASYMSVIHAMC